jgi:hypothetical protein
MNHAVQQHYMRITNFGAGKKPVVQNYIKEFAKQFTTRVYGSNANVKINPLEQTFSFNNDSQSNPQKISIKQVAYGATITCVLCEDRTLWISNKMDCYLQTLDFLNPKLLERTWMKLDFPVDQVSCTANTLMTLTDG